MWKKMQMVTTSAENMLRFQVLKYIMKFLYFGITNINTIWVAIWNKCMTYLKIFEFLVNVIKAVLQL